MTTSAAATNERLKWVGCLLVLGLVLAFGFAGYRVWGELRRKAPAVIPLPSARPVAVRPPVADTALPVSPLPPLELAPAAPEGPVRLELGELTVVGGQPPEIVRGIVRQNFARFRLCAERAVLADNRVRPGTLTLRFIIGGDGTVEHILLGNGGTALPEVAACIEQAFRALSFPRPEGGIASVKATINWTY